MMGCKDIDGFVRVVHPETTSIKPFNQQQNIAIGGELTLCSLAYLRGEPKAGLIGTENNNDAGHLLGEGSVLKLLGQERDVDGQTFFKVRVIKDGSSCPKWCGKCDAVTY